MFGLSGEQKNVTGPVGGSSGDRDTDKVVYGVDLSGNFDETLFWYAQGLWNQWDGFIDENKTYEWFGGFAVLRGSIISPPIKLSLTTS